MKFRVMKFRVMWLRLKIRICLWLLDSLRPNVTYWTNARGGDGFDEVDKPKEFVHLITLDFGERDRLSLHARSGSYELFRSARANRTG